KDNTPDEKSFKTRKIHISWGSSPPKEDIQIRHHPRKDESTIPPDQHTPPDREAKELMKQDEVIKGTTQPEKILINEDIHRIGATKRSPAHYIPLLKESKR
ncbi:hypothetical protein Tco_0447116, partial [Tanacetum coccineum]